MTRHKTRTQKELDAVVDGNWTNFNEKFRHIDFNEKELKYMLDREMKGEQRRQFALALHQRYSTLRNINERMDLFKVCGGMPL